MTYEFAKGTLFPEDDLAPVTSESVRYFFQMKRLNHVVIGLRELDLSLGEELRVMAGFIGPLKERLDETRHARVSYEEQCARQDELTTTVRALEERMPDNLPSRL